MSSPKDPLLCLVDGNNLVIRAHGAFAKQNLTTSSGHPTSGLFGSIMSHLHLVRMLQPTQMVWYFDRGGSDMRRELLSTYKGNRPRKDKKDDLHKTFSAFEAFLSTMDVRYYSEEGVEADDLIAASITRFDPSVPKVIVSADHDFHQLVSKDPKVSVLKLKQGKSPQEIYTPSKVVEKYGCEAKFLSQLWAITGDASDNIPGVKGVGPVTAKKILDKYGWDFERAITKDPKLRDHRDIIERNYKLINLDGSVARLFVNLDETELKRTNYDREMADKFLNKWELNSLRLKNRGPGIYA